MKKIINPMLISVAVTILVSACGNQSSLEEARIPTYVAETAVARQSATAIIEQALAAALTGSAPPPSATPTPTATTTPTETPFPTPTPNPMVEVVVGLAQIRGGPGIAYKVIQNASEGDTFEVIGRSENGRWLVVRLVLDEQGWILSDQVQGLENTERLKVFEIPPTPQTRFTITIVNNLKPGSGSILLRSPSAGGIWISVKVGESFILTIPGDIYTFVYGTTEIHCTVTFTLLYNIYWAPTTNGDEICDSFP